MIAPKRRWTDAMSGTLRSLERQNRQLRERVRELEAKLGTEEQIGWIQFDGDEYHGFRYLAPNDLAGRPMGAWLAEGYEPVFVRTPRGDDE